MYFVYLFSIFIVIIFITIKMTVDYDAYDFAIIGGGIAGLYTMYKILKKRPHSKIILI
jgi:ribulose 1,5-bisphosphate synthetase/thiazole synthase